MSGSYVVDVSEERACGRGDSSLVSGGGGGGMSEADGMLEDGSDDSGKGSDECEGMCS